MIHQLADRVWGREHRGSLSGFVMGFIMGREHVFVPDMILCPRTTVASHCSVMSILNPFAIVCLI